MIDVFRVECNNEVDVHGHPRNPVQIYRQPAYQEITHVMLGKGREQALVKHARNSLDRDLAMISRNTAGAILQPQPPRG